MQVQTPSGQQDDLYLLDSNMSVEDIFATPYLKLVFVAFGKIMNKPELVAFFDDLLKFELLVYRDSTHPDLQSMAQSLVQQYLSDPESESYVPLDQPIVNEIIKLMNNSEWKKMWKTARTQVKAQLKMDMLPRFHQFIQQQKRTSLPASSIGKKQEPIFLFDYSKQDLFMRREILDKDFIFAELLDKDNPDWEVLQPAHHHQQHILSHMSQQPLKGKLDCIKQFFGTRFSFTVNYSALYVLAITCNFEFLQKVNPQILYTEIPCHYDDDKPGHYKSYIINYIVKGPKKESQIIISHAYRYIDKEKKYVNIIKSVANPLEVAKVKGASPAEVFVCYQVQELGPTMCRYTCTKFARFSGSTSKTAIKNFKDQALEVANNTCLAITSFLDTYAKYNFQPLHIHEIVQDNLICNMKRDGCCEELIFEKCFLPECR